MLSDAFALQNALNRGDALSPFRYSLLAGRRDQEILRSVLVILIADNMDITE
jgi:hypothetical protein